jgi:hypothetical protein
MKYVLALFVLIGASQLLRADEKVTPEQLAARAPVIRGDDAAIKSLHVRGTQYLDANDPLYHFDFVFQKPDHCSLFVWDGLDHVPLLIAVDNQVMLYDPSSNVIETFAARPSFTFGAEGNNFGMGFALYWGDLRAGTIKFDIPSVLKNFTNDRKLTPLEKGEYTLTGMSGRGNTCSCTVAPDEKYAFKSFDMVGPTAPRVRLAQIDVNPSHLDLRAMPNLQEFKSPIPIHRADAPDMNAVVVKMTQTTLRAMFYRRAIYRPAFRENPLVKSPTFIDWAAARERDELAAKSLKELAAWDEGGK